MNTIDAKIDWTRRLAAARELAAPCRLCQIRCGVDRIAGERGRCGLGDEVPVYGRMLHMGEEQMLVPSFVVSLSGCSMHCTFCSEDAHLRPPFAGEVLDPTSFAQSLATQIRGLRVRPRNINFVGGEPSISLPFLLATAEALEAHWPEHPSLLLNTNGYLTPEALELCRDVFEIFVVDLKFGPGEEGYRIGKVREYFETVTERILEIAAFAPRPELVVRHLVMPGHVDCCTRPVLDWLEENVPWAAVNVMSGFVRFGGTRARKHWPADNTSEEVERARELLAERALDRPLWNGGPLVA